jgi:hypothetical protein
MFRFITPVLCASVLALAGCQTTTQAPTPAVSLTDISDRATFIAAGAAPVSNLNYLTGDSVSFAFPGGTTVYTADGQKLWQTPDGTTERRWRQRADGVYCEELVGSGQEVCSDRNNRLFALGEDIRLFSATGEPEFLIRRTGSRSFAAQRPDPEA